MSELRYDDEKFSILLATKSDGIFGIHPRMQTEVAEKNRKDFLYSHGVEHISILIPHGGKIFFEKQDDAPFVVRGQGLVMQPVVSCMRSIGIFTADCPPLAVLDKKTGVAAILHINWLQIVLNLPKRFFKAWFQRFPTSRTDIHMFIGPGICSQCFTLSGWKGWVRIILFSLSGRRADLKKENGVYTFDLKSALVRQLKAIGFADGQIVVAPECTCEDHNLSSNRREGLNRTSSNFVVVKIK